LIPRVRIVPKLCPIFWRNSIDLAPKQAASKGSANLRKMRFQRPRQLESPDLDRSSSKKIRGIGKFLAAIGKT
jgi:hypothetical protein